MIGVQLTANSRRSLFRCIVYRSLAPIFGFSKLCRSAQVDFRHKKTAMLSGADCRY
nr:MAG TPA: hypothetical protein [Caudoviricetes sp.]